MAAFYFVVSLIVTNMLCVFLYYGEKYKEHNFIDRFFLVYLPPFTHTHTHTYHPSLLACFPQIVFSLIAHVSFLLSLSLSFSLSFKRVFISNFSFLLSILFTRSQEIFIFRLSVCFRHMFFHNSSPYFTSF